MSMITATRWVPRGYAAEFPARHEFNEDEYDRIANIAQLNLDDAREDLDEATKDNDAPQNAAQEAKVRDSLPQTGADDDLKEYDMDHYDDEPEAGDNENEDDGPEEGHSNIFGNIKSLAFHESNDDDPYITLKGGETADSDDEDREDLQILPTDSLLLAARVEDEMAHLEVYVYEDDADNLYVHHDIMLPAIPLCVEWLDFPVGKEGVAPDSRANFVAVGTMDPDIEIWDLDTMDSMFPNAILGAGAPAADASADKPKKKKKKSKKIQDGYHVDAVLSLAANRQHRNLLASASADTTVKLWDLTTQKCAKSYTHHTDKVCSLAWHPTEATAMLSGSYDRTAAAADMRTAQSEFRHWSVDSDVEMVRWDPHDDKYFYVSTESGMLYYFDARSAGKKASPVWRLQAHEKAVTAFSPSAHTQGLLATGGDDRTVKLWDARKGTGTAVSGGPGLLASRDLDVGRVFGVDFAPDQEVGLRLAVAGSKGALRVWDTQTNKAIQRTFGRKATSNGDGGVAVDPSNEKERIISGGDGGAGTDDETDSDSEDGEGDDAADPDDEGMDQD